MGKQALKIELTWSKMCGVVRPRKIMFCFLLNFFNRGRAFK